jgi:alkyl hydroperoxide reductase subunit AhpC
MGIQVGKTAPEIAAQAYWRGEIKEVRLSDYRGNWVLVFFYPADFTFV